MTPTEPSWMDDVIEGKDHTELSDDTADITDEDVQPHEEGASIKLVVDAFLSKADQFEPADLEGYINTALQNEGGDIVASRAYAQDVTEGWQGYAENLTNGSASEFANMTAEEATAKGEAVMAKFGTDYAEGRRLLAEAVVDLHDANAVPLTAHTWGVMVDLDDDGYLSEALGFDPQNALAAAKTIEKQNATRAAQSSTTAPAVSTAPVATAVDFSRDIGVDPLEDPRTRQKETDPEPEVDYEAEHAQVETDAAARQVYIMDARADVAVARERQQDGTLVTKQSVASREPMKLGDVFKMPGFADAWSQANRDKMAEAMEIHNNKEVLDRLAADPETVDAGGAELG
jgi:hypothetical protein